MLVLRKWRGRPGGVLGLLLALPVLGLFLVFFLLPFINLARVGARGDGFVANLNSYFHSGVTLRIFWVTLRDCVLVTVLSIGGGAVLAWRMKTSSRRFEAPLILAAVFIPLWMGGLLKIYSFIFLFQRTGPINGALMALGVFSEPKHLLYSESTIVLGMTFQMLPLAVAPLYAVFSSFSPELITAAEGLGASRIKTFRTVVAPLTSIGIVASSLLVYLISLGFFLTPVFLGGANAPFTSSLISSDLFDYFDPPSAGIGAILLVCAGLVIALIAGTVVLLIRRSQGFGREKSWMVRLDDGAGDDPAPPSARDIDARAEVGGVPQ